MPQPSEYTLVELKERARALALSTSGTKAELITRIMEADPDGEWLKDNNEKDSRCGGDLYEREMDINRREKEMAERELELARREIAMLRANEHADATNPARAADNGRESTANRARATEDGRSGATAQPLVQMRMNLTTIADLVNEFDGVSSDFDTWEKQIKLVKMTYKLEDDFARILVGMKLKKKALEWFHSRPEHVEMTFDALIGEIRKMFRHHQSKVTLRKKFEGRLWKKDETFHEYFHEKMILGNRVPIAADEILDYIIDGIPDKVMRDQTRMQRFDTTESLLEAFEKITIRDRYTTNSGRSDKRTSGTTTVERGEKTSEDNKSSKSPVGRDGAKKTANIRRCYNCGARDHVGAACPTKELGVKCFECGEHGHIASKCPTKNKATSACVVTRPLHKKYTKDVMVNGRNITALIDTGSDISLMRADEYVSMGSPQFRPTKLQFSGIGSENIAALGEFQAEITIDGHNYPILIRVVSDTVSRQKLLVGTDFLDTVEIRIKQGAIHIDPIGETIGEGTQPEVFQIDIDDKREADKIDLSYIQDAESRRTIANVIENYKPNQIVETDVKMKLILKDDEVVYQKARRLSPSEKNIVNAQIEEWEKQGIVRPSSSDYASPVVLVKKKDGSHRLCIDYRLLNRKIIKDRYPLPLIEDQLDQLQDTKVFSTLDLKNGFFHVRIDEASVRYTAFIVPDGQYEFLRVPFGLCNSPSVFQRYVNAIFRRLIQDKIILIYMDDLIVLSDDGVSGLRNLKKALETASAAGLLINWKKCRFLQKKVEFLGHTIGEGSVRPSEYQTEAVKRFPEPTNIRQIQAFLGLTGYFRKFIPGYATIARPLSNLLRANIKFSFGVVEKDAFARLKMLLSERPVLNLYKIGADTELHTDASKDGYGAILLQRDSSDQLLHPIYYASGKTTPAEEKYTSYELEVLAIIKALKRFRVYLLGIPFKIVTDCRAFALTMSKKDLCVRVARWALALEEFQYAIEHRPGRSMVHVDALSRNSLPSCLVISECEAGLTARLRRALKEDKDLRRKLVEAQQGQLDGYIVQGGLLYKNVDDEMRLVVPKSMQQQIIRRAHERGHFAVSKTEDLVKSDYWIPGVRSKVEKIVQNCISCILAERRQGKRECFLNPIEKGSTPLDTFHIDHLGPLPSTKKSYIYIFAVVDAFSKFVWLYATKSTTAAEVIDRLQKQSIVFGNPRRIISDRGSAFTSKEFKEYCRAEGIEHSLITTGIPRGNGQVERLNRTLIPLMTKLSAPKSGEWHKYVDLVQQCLNTTPHRSIGMTPFRLLFGAHPRIRDNPDIQELLQGELVTSFVDDREDLRQEAKKSIERIQRENKTNYDAKRKEAFHYREGDMVAIRRTQHAPGQKFAHKYLGPYEVIKILRNDRYLVRKIGEREGPLQTSSSADSMKPWIHDDDGDDVSDDDPELEVDKHSGRMSGQDGRM